MLGQRRRRYPSHEAFVASLHQRTRDDWRGCLHPLHCKTKARPLRSLLVPRPSSRLEAHMEFGPLQRAPRGQAGYEPHL
jgi:hypothetical protein